jgi:hypothetical protein
LTSALGQTPSFELSLSARGSQAVGGARNYHRQRHSGSRALENKGSLLARSGRCCRGKFGRSQFASRCLVRHGTALFDLAIDSKLRASERIGSSSRTSAPAPPFAIVPSSRNWVGKTCPVEIIEATRQSVEGRPAVQSSSGGCLFRSRWVGGGPLKIRAHFGPVGLRAKSKVFVM